MSSKRQRSIPLGGRYRQVSLYTAKGRQDLRRLACWYVTTSFIRREKHVLFGASSIRKTKFSIAEYFKMRTTIIMISSITFSKEFQQINTLDTTVTSSDIRQSTTPPPPPPPPPPPHPTHPHPHPPPTHPHPTPLKIICVTLWQDHHGERDTTWHTLLLTHNPLVLKSIEERKYISIFYYFSTGRLTLTKRAGLSCIVNTEISSSPYGDFHYKYPMTMLLKDWNLHIRTSL